MSALPWFRLYHRTIDDDKLRLLAFEDRWHFIALCCLKADGLLDEPDSDIRTRRIAVKMGVQVRELDEIGRRLREVDLVDDMLCPVSWEELQQRSDSSSERVKKHRENKRKAALEQDETLQQRYSNALDREEDRDKEEEKNIARKRAVVCPDGVNPQTFSDFRRQRKTSFTQTAMDRFQKEAVRAGWPLQAAFEEAVARGWQSFKADWVKDNGRNSRPERKSVLDIAAELGGDCGPPIGLPSLGPPGWHDRG